MLRRLNVRTRLVAVIAVPLVLLLATATPEVLDRRAEASAADRVSSLAREAGALNGAAEALQAERTLSAAHRAGASDQVATALGSQRAVTDLAVSRAVDALGRIVERDRSLGEKVDAALHYLGQLDAIRSDTDRGQALEPWLDPFERAISALLDVEEALGAVAVEAGIGNELAVSALLSRVKDAMSDQSAQVAAALAWGELRSGQRERLTTLRGEEDAWRTAYLAASAPAIREDRRAELSAGAGATAARDINVVIASRSIEPAGRLAEWLERSAERQIVFRDALAARTAEAVDAASKVGSSARRSSNGFLALSGLGLLLALAVALLAARSITRPLRRLTDAADDLAEERLPRLVDALRNPGEDDERYLAATIEPLDTGFGDELGHLAKAFNAVQAVAVEVASQQASYLRKGISDLYVNLARRNQALIDRQIQLLDRLEASEEDPQVLDHLYQLDHLATRMRRNAESLLILAGAESGPHRSQPVDMVDVVRASLSEVEDYGRVDLGVLASATVVGPAVSDVAHLLAELLENATQFSPPDTMVRIDGGRTGGSYQLVVTDQGVGMTQSQLDELNAVLREPPVTGLALGRALGCLVAARLAARHGITVRLRAGESVGTAAYVVIPRHLLADEVSEPPAARMPRTERSSRVTPTDLPLDVADAFPAPDLVGATVAAVAEGAEPDPWLDDWATPAVVEPDRRHEPASSASADTPRPSDRVTDPGPIAGSAAPVEPEELTPGRLRDALPRRAAFDAGLRALLEGNGPVARIEPPVSGQPIAPGGGAATVADSLPRRRPPTPAPGGGTPPAVRRSPEEVRSMLSRYRSGLEAGRRSENGTEAGDQEVEGSEPEGHDDDAAEWRA